MARRIKQLTLAQARHHSGRGGPRRGAGRPRGKRPRVLHRRRTRIDAHAPQHVTIRVRRGLPTLRQPRFVRRFRVTLSQACARHGFRVVHYSIQPDHVHLLVEANNKYTIACGMKSLGARLGKLANRLFQRKGKVLDGRYHLRPLRTPLEVRRALCYVLLNHRHHAAKRHRRAPTVALDPASSGRWFDGWRVAAAPPPGTDLREVAWPKTWLLRTGWRRHGLIDRAEVPG
jgi:REP element-mobilizing transposase RayT